MNSEHETIHKPDQLTGHTLQVAEPDPGFFSEDSTEDLGFYQLFQATSSPAKKDVAESQRVAEAIRATPMQCWFTARTAILKLEDFADASYCEGWASTSFGFCFEHGWIVRGETIIDPTQTEEGTVYFPGLEFPGRTGIAEFLATPKGSKCNKSPFFGFGFGGMKSAWIATVLRRTHGMAFGPLEGTRRRGDNDENNDQSFLKG